VVLGWHEQCAASPQWAAHHGVRALARGPRQRCAPPTRPRPPPCAQERPALQARCVLRPTAAIPRVVRDAACPISTG